MSYQQTLDRIASLECSRIPTGGHCQNRQKEQSEQARLLCWRLSKRVAAVAPKGLGRWPRAWSIVAGSSHRFLVTLARWEAEGSAIDRARLVEAADRVVEDWRRAAAEWTRAGKPAADAMER